MVQPSCGAHPNIPPHTTKHCEGTGLVVQCATLHTYVISAMVIVPGLVTPVLPNVNGY